MNVWRILLLTALIGCSTDEPPSTPLADAETKAAKPCPPLPDDEWNREDGRVARHYDCMCERGDPESCEQRARDAQYSSAGKPTQDQLDLWRKYDEQTARAYFDRCSPKTPEDCTEAGEAWKQLGHKNDLVPDEDNEYYRLARVAYERGCELDEHDSCFMLAIMKKFGRGGPVDRIGARAAYRRDRELVEPLCLNDGEECLHLLLLLNHGDGGPRDPQRAHEIQKMVCDRGGAPLMCSSVAANFYFGAFGPRDFAKAREYYRKGCFGANMLASRPCIPFGQMAEKGIGGPKDPESALEAYLHSCKEWDRDSCVYLERLETAFNQPTRRKR